MGRSDVREKLGPAQCLRMTGGPLCARALHAASSCFRLWYGGQRGRFLEQRGPEKGQGDVVLQDVSCTCHSFMEKVVLSSQNGYDSTEICRQEVGGYFVCLDATTTHLLACISRNDQ